MYRCKDFVRLPIFFYLFPFGSVKCRHTRANTLIHMNPLYNVNTALQSCNNNRAHKVCDNFWLVSRQNSRALPTNVSTESKKKTTTMKNNNKNWHLCWNFLNWKNIRFVLDFHFRLFAIIFTVCTLYIYVYIKSMLRMMRVICWMQFSVYHIFSVFNCRPCTPIAWNLYSYFTLCYKFYFYGNAQICEYTQTKKN